MAKQASCRTRRTLCSSECHPIRTPSAVSTVRQSWPLPSSSSRLPSFVLTAMTGSNRTSHIYHVRPGSDAQPISSITDRADYAARFVTVSPDGQSIAYFTSTNEFTHGSVESLRVIPWNAAEGQPAGATRTAIEPVALSDGEHSFPGLYVGTVVAKAWLDNEHFDVTSIWRSQYVRRAPARTNSTWHSHSRCTGLACSR